MSRVLEDLGKEILRENRIRVPDFFVVSNEEEARTAADEVGYPVAIKALVTIGRRGKAGAVKFAENSREAEEIAKAILSMEVHNFPVKRLLVEKKLDILQELYVSVTFDTCKQMPVIIASTAGGVDIEEVARAQPNKILKHHVDI